MLKKLLFLSLSLSLALSPYARSEQAHVSEQTIKQFAQEQLKDITKEISSLTPEEQTAFKQAALETFEQLPEKTKANLKEYLLPVTLAFGGVVALVVFVKCCLCNNSRSCRENIQENIQTVRNRFTNWWHVMPNTEDKTK